MNLIQIKMLIGSTLYDGSIIRDIKSYPNIKALLAELKHLDPDYYSELAPEIVQSLSRVKKVYLVRKELPSGASIHCIFTESDFKRNKYLKKVQNRVDKLLASKDVIDVESKCKVISAKVFSNIYEIDQYASNKSNHISKDELTRFINTYGVQEFDYLIVLTLNTMNGLEGSIVPSVNINNQLATRVKLFSVMQDLKGKLPKDLYKDFDTVVNYFAVKPNLSF
jgi:hypothetical protein